MNIEHRVASDEARKAVRKASRKARQIKLRQAAADSLYGIWAGLPKRAVKELLKKSYP